MDLLIDGYCCEVLDVALVMCGENVRLFGFYFFCVVKFKICVTIVVYSKYLLCVYIKLFNFLNYFER